MTFVKCHNTSVTNGNFTLLAKELQLFFFMVLLLAIHCTFQHVFNVFILKISNRQHSMCLIRFNQVMSCTAIFAPEGATLKAIETLGACFFAVSTLHSTDVAFLNSHDIQQTVHSKVGWQVFRITAPGNLELSATFRTSDFAVLATRSLKLVQTMEAKCMKARQYFWISERAHTHRTGHFLV